MLEFAIAFPVLLLICFALLDFSRIILVKTVLRNGALRASELATVVQNLELEDDVTHPDRKTMRDAALLELYRRAVVLPITSGYGVSDEQKFAQLVPYPASERASLPANSQVALPADEPSLAAVMITLPDPSENIGVDINQIFQENPIKIELNGEVRPFLPFIKPIRFTERIEVYREPRNIATKPVRLDCNGDPFVPGKKVTCPCPPAGPGLPAPPNMVENEDRTTCVCKDTFTEYTPGAGCACDAAHYESTRNNGEKYCACRLGSCPMDPTHPDDPVLNQNFSLKECKCVDADCPPGSIVREDGSCGGCNYQNCAALGPSYVPDPNDDCACKSCDALFGANPPRIGQQGVCVCANKEVDKPKCLDSEIWSDQLCKCMPCGANLKADLETHTKCECSDATIRKYMADRNTPPGAALCDGPGGWWFFSRATCQCESCVYGTHEDGKFHVGTQSTSTNIGNIDGHAIPFGCECVNDAVPAAGTSPQDLTCACKNSGCPPAQIYDQNLCKCRDCFPGMVKGGPTWCDCPQVVALQQSGSWDGTVNSLCPAGKAWHGGDCYCYDCPGFAHGYADKDYSNGYTCKCLTLHSQADCPANTHYANYGLGGCDCVPCSATDFQAKIVGCQCDVNAAGCSNTQKVDSTCQCQDCPPCQVRDPSDASKCVNPCGAAGDRCVVDGLCCLTGQTVVTASVGKVCVSTNSPCKNDPNAPTCSVGGCTNTALGMACQLVQQE